MFQALAVRITTSLVFHVVQQGHTFPPVISPTAQPHNVFVDLFTCLIKRLIIQRIGIGGLIVPRRGSDE